MVIMVAANSLQNRPYRIILSQWGSRDKLLQGEIGNRVRTFRWKHVLLLCGREKPRSPFSFSLKSNLYPIWVPQRVSILLPGVLEKKWASSLLTVNSVPRVWGTHQGMKYWFMIMVILCSMILLTFLFGHRILLSKDKFTVSIAASFQLKRILWLLPQSSCRSHLWAVLLRVIRICCIYLLILALSLSYS